MNNILEIAIIVGPLFLLMGIGILLRIFVRKELLWTRTESLVRNILLPVIFVYILSSINHIRDFHWELLALLVAATIIGALLIGVWTRVRSMDKSYAMSAIQGVTQYNILIASTGVLLGFGFDGLKAAIFISALLLLIGNVYNIGAAQWIGKYRDLKAAFKAAILNPPVIGCLIGFFMQSEGLELPELLDNILQPVAQATLPLGIILAGAKLIGATGPLPWKKAAPLAVVKVLIMPALTAFLAPWFGVMGTEALIGAALVFAVAPVTFGFYAEGSKADPALQMAVLRLQTLGFIVTLPLWLELTNYLQ